MVRENESLHFGKVSHFAKVDYLDNQLFLNYVVYGRFANAHTDRTFRTLSVENFNLENKNTMDLKKYINRSKSNDKEIWLHNLPNDKNLFDVIDKLRKVHKEETLVFTEEINIIKKTIDKDVNFSNCIFQEDVNFSGCIFGEKDKEKDKEKVGATSLKDKVDFKDCVFTKEADFSETIFEQDTNFSRSIFCVVSFQDAVFYKNVRFHETIFHNNVDFFNTSFKGLVDFYLVKFEDDQQFHTTDFLDRAIFSNTTFKGEAQFIYNKVDKNSYINFESAKFEKGLDISRANFNCNLNFWNIFIQNKNISEFTKYIDDFGEHKEEATPSVYKQLRETYRIIKDNSYKQNNKIEALEFSKREMLVYERELKSVSSKSNNDKLLLLANKVSNNFGTNWLRGILFTASTGIITYLLMLCCLPFIHNTYIIISFTFIIIIISAFSFLNKDIDSFLPILILIILSFLLAIILFKSPFLYKENIHIKDYIIPDFIKILNVIDLKPFEKEENSIFNLSGLSYLFLFIGRIFIGYGYYQTIQAFRKFGKS